MRFVFVGVIHGEIIFWRCSTLKSTKTNRILFDSRRWIVHEEWSVLSIVRAMAKPMLHSLHQPWRSMLRESNREVKTGRITVPLTPKHIDQQFSDEHLLFGWTMIFQIEKQRISKCVDSSCLVLSTNQNRRFHLRWSTKGEFFDLSENFAEISIFDEGEGMTNDRSSICSIVQIH